jgi:hypothetical protein
MPTEKTSLLKPPLPVLRISGAVKLGVPPAALLLDAPACLAKPKVAQLGLEPDKLAVQQQVVGLDVLVFDPLTNRCLAALARSSSQPSESAKGSRGHSVQEGLRAELYEPAGQSGADCIVSPAPASTSYNQPRA